VLARIIIGLGVSVILFAIAGRRFYWVSRLIRSGQPAPRRWQGLRKVTDAEVVEVAGQRKLLKWTVPGLAHFFTMWGFTVLFTTIIEAYGSLFDRNFHIPWIGQDNWLAFTEDFFATAVLVSLGAFTIIRIKNAPARKERASRFYGSHTRAAWMVLVMIALVIVTLLVYRGAQINTGHFPYTHIKPGFYSVPHGLAAFYASHASSWAFASKIVASWLAPLGYGVNSVLEAVFLLLNIAVIASFLVFVAYSKHLHIFLAPINVGTSRRPRALGGLDKTPNMDMEQVSEDTVFGAGKIEDFTWKQMLDLATCTECGRCQSVCPAWNTGKPLSPKLLIMGLRDNMFASADRLLSGETGGDVVTLVPTTIDPDVLWSCTTCGACVEECPVDIEHIDAIIDMRRFEVLMESRFPTPGDWARASVPSGWRPSISRFRSLTASSPTTSNTSTGWGAPARSTSAAASRSSQPRACCTAPASPSASSGRASPAPETRRDAWATNTSIKRWPRPTSPPSTRPVRRRSSPVVRTALIR
jgi:ferredoxin